MNLARFIQSIINLFTQANTWTGKQIFNGGAEVKDPVNDADAVNLKTLKSFDFDAGEF